MNNYARGRAFEYRCRNELRAKGYTVIRSAQSKGCADLVALTAGVHARAGEYPESVVLLVQCKLGAGAVAPGEWNALYLTAEAAGAIPVIVLAGGRGQSKTWWRLTGLKDGKGGKQPHEEFQP
jgi:Holliday junction resolvase